MRATLWSVARELATQGHFAQPELSPKTPGENDSSECGARPHSMVDLVPPRG